MSEISSKLKKLAELYFRRHGDIPVIDRDSDEWKAWRQWRLDNGLGVGHMDSVQRYTVVSRYPPVDLDKALTEACGSSLAGKLGKK